MRYRRDNPSDLRQVTNELGVTNVLEGTIRRDGNRVRICTELVDAVNDSTIWADSYDRYLTDVLTTKAKSLSKSLLGYLPGSNWKGQNGSERKLTDNWRAFGLISETPQRRLSLRRQIIRLRSRLLAIPRLNFANNRLAPSLDDD